MKFLLITFITFAASVSLFSESWQIKSQTEWKKNIQSSKGIIIKDNVVSPMEKVGHFKTKLKKFKSKKSLPLGKSVVRFQLDYDGGGTGKGADAQMTLNGEVVAEGRLEKTIASRFSIDEGSDVGLDRGSAVTVKSIGPRRNSAYGGQIDKVTIQIYPKESDQNKV